MCACSVLSIESLEIDVLSLVKLLAAVDHVLKLYSDLMQIRKREVDNYSIGKGIPACMLRACVLNTDDLPDLEAIINLEGASGDRTFFEVHVRALGEFWENILKQHSCM